MARRPFSLLTVAGGAIGTLLGLGGTALIQRFAAWPTAVHPLILAIALLVGIGFGFYPASHASRLEPMTALRGE